MVLLKDKDFIRGKCPMTKEDIRALSIWKLNLDKKSDVLDIGSGTGTITVQCAKIATEGKVYSLERSDEAYETTKLNIEKFQCNNVELVKGEALEIIEGYVREEKKFDSIFLGGSGGNLKEILICCDKLITNTGTIVMNFITLDNAYNAIEKIKELGYKIDVSMVNISKNRENTYMMIANNPIYIVQCVRSEE